MPTPDVFDVNVAYGDNIGKTVLPAAIQPVDFSTLDRALQTEQDIAKKAVDTMSGNLAHLGKLQDELTQIPLANPYHAQQLAAAKKEVGLNDDELKGALSQMDNPTALYDVDRKMKKLYMNPKVKDIMYDNAIIENFKQNLKTISDPYLRAKAVSDLANAHEDQSGTAVKDLNLSMYETVDVAGAYKAIIDQFAPPKETSVRKEAPDGTSYTNTVTERDPAAIKKAREYFMKNKKIANNLMAQGIMGEDGSLIADEKDGKNWFDVIEAGELQSSNKITDVKGAQNQSKAKTTADYSIGAEDSKPLEYTPNVVDGFDLGLLASVETGGRSVTVHADPVKDPIVNFGAYSFNREVAKDFLGSLRANTSVKDKTGKNKEINATIDEILASNMTDTSKENLEKLNNAYHKLETLMPSGALAQSETDYVLNNFAKNVEEYAVDAGVPLLEGGKTFLMDSSVQFGADKVQYWIDEYAKDNKGANSLEEFIYKKRLDWAASTGKLTDANRPSVISRIKRVYATTMGKAAPAADAAGSTDASAGVDMSQYEGIYNQTSNPPASSKKSEATTNPKDPSKSSGSSW